LPRGKDRKVVVELAADTVENIEKVRDILVGSSNYRWMRYVPLDGFIDLFFGASPLSEHCRKLLNKVVMSEAEHILTVRLPEPENPKGYYPSAYAKLIKVFLKDGPELCLRHLSAKTGWTVGRVRNVLQNLRKKGIVSSPHGKAVWELNMKELKKWKCRRTVKEKLTELLSKGPLPVSEILRKLPGEEEETVRKCLSKHFLWRDGKWSLRSSSA